MIHTLFRFSLLFLGSMLTLIAKGKGDIQAYVTTASLTKDLASEAISFSDNVPATDFQVSLSPKEQYQKMDGFGAALTGSACFNLMQMKPADRTAFLKETFADDGGFGFSYVRVSIGCSDFSLGEYTCCDTPGVEHFALQSDETKYVIPIIKEILAIRPSLKIMAAPWTCPKWMKVRDLKSLEPYDSWTGGQLNPKYYQDYATYFVKWIQAFQKEGIAIYAVTPQNEPLNRGNSASLYMGWEEERDFIKTALGPKFVAAGLSTRIYVFDHNYNYDNIADQQEYPLKIYADADASKYITGAAFHDYGGNILELDNVHNAAPDKELVFTETSIGTWNSGRDLQKSLLRDMRNVALGTVNNWCNGVIVWNLMLDNDRAPNRDGGCQTCYGAVDISNSDYKTITRNSHYYIIAHMSSVVKPEATRIGSNCTGDNGVVYSAFRNTDGTYALVLVNAKDTDYTISVNDGTRHFEYKVPAKSIVSFRW